MTRPVRIVGAPTDFGANRRGVDMGPSAIRYAGIEDSLEAIATDCEDAGDVPVPRARDGGLPEPSIEGKARHLAETEEVCTRLAEEVRESIQVGRLPVALGGDHSIAIGSLSGAAADAEIGTIWFDAHGDYNSPETTPSGNVHGMPLAAALGYGAFAEMDWARAPGLREENVVLVGLRSLDDAERERIEDSDATAFTMTDIDERGIVEVVREALEVATDGVEGIHVSFDMDLLDPDEAPGVGTPVRGGITYREAHAAMELVAERDAAEDVMRSIEFVEVNPILDSHNRTAELATELAASAVGKRIL